MRLVQVFLFFQEWLLQLDIAFFVVIVSDNQLGSASGTIQPDNASIERRISIIGNVVEDRLWMGSSGAPVFEFNEESRSYSFIGIKLKVLGNYQDSLSMLSIHEALKNKELEKAFENFHPLIDQFIIPDPYSDDKTKENIIKSIVDVFKDQDDLIVLPFLFSLNEGSSIGSDFEKTAKYLVDQDPKDAILLIVGTVRGLLSSKRNKIVDGNRSGLIFFVEKLVSYLPILSIDYTDISKLSPYLLSSSFPSLYFKMGEVRTISGVEIVLSRRFNRFPSFKGGPKKTLKAKNGININDFNLKWNESETVVRWKKIIWNKFFEYDALDLNDHNLKFDISKNGELNSRIKIDRTNKKEQMFLSVDISSVPCGEEFKKEIFNALMQDLNQLTFVEFNYEGDDCIYIDNEYDLTTIISDFYRDCY